MSLSSQLWLLPLCDLWGPCRPLRSRSGAGSAARAGPSLSFTGGNCWKGLRDSLLQLFPFTGEDQSRGRGFCPRQRGQFRAELPLRPWLLTPSALTAVAGMTGTAELWLYFTEGPRQHCPPALHQPCPSSDLYRGQKAF